MTESDYSPDGGEPTVVLWGTKTSRVMRAHWALRELGIPYTNHPVETRTAAMDEADFRAVSPQRKIPVLVDGDLVLSESSAIVTYLGERYGRDGCRLVPTGIAERARYFEWLSFACMELDATALYVLRRHADLTQIYGDEPGASETARQYFDRMIHSVLHRVPTHGYLLGEQFSGADIVMTTCLQWAQRYGMPIPYRFEEYLRLTTSRPAFAAAARANQNTVENLSK